MKLYGSRRQRVGIGSAGITDPEINGPRTCAMSGQVYKIISAVRSGRLNMESGRDRYFILEINQRLTCNTQEVETNEIREEAEDQMNGLTRIQKKRIMFRVSCEKGKTPQRWMRRQQRS